MISQCSRTSAQFNPLITRMHREWTDCFWRDFRYKKVIVPKFTELLIFFWLVVNSNYPLIPFLL